MQLTVDATAIDALAEEWDRKADRIGPATRDAVGTAAEAGATVARQTAPRRTGELAGSIEVLVQGSGMLAGASAVIRATARHSPFVEYGTSRMAPQPYMQPGADEAQRVLETELVRAAAEILT